MYLETLTSNSLFKMPSTRISETAIRQLLQQAADLPVNALFEEILEGGGHQTWSVGNDMILRLGLCGDDDDDPTEIRERQKREVAVREFLNGCYSLAGHTRVIPEGLALQAVEHHNVVSFCLDRKVDGISLETMSATPATVDGLVCLFKVLRSASFAEIQNLGLPRIPLPCPSSLKKHAYRAWKRLADNEQLSDALREYNFEKIIEDSASFLTDSSWPLINTPVLLHGDLKGEHILLNSLDGAVVGVLDWEDAGYGHVAIDINGLAISVGASYAADIGRRAGYDRAVVLAGVFLARCETALRLDDRLHGDDKDSPKELLVAQLKRAFEQVDELP